MNLPISVPATTFIGHISASSLNTYLICPKQFWFRYIAGKQPEFRSVALPFGSAWGTTIQHWLVENNVSKLSARDLLEVFETEFHREMKDSEVDIVFDKNQTEELLLETARKMLGVLVEKVQPPDEVLGIETAFSVTLAHPDDPDEVIPVPLLGALDAVVVQGGAPVIWEFKSAARKYSPDQFEFMLQPTAYQLGAKVFGHEELPVDVIVTTKTAKPDVQVQRLKKNHRDRRQFYELADNVIRAVGAGVFPRCRGWQCSGCGYREDCAAR